MSSVLRDSDLSAYPHDRVIEIFDRFTELWSLDRTVDENIALIKSEMRPNEYGFMIGYAAGKAVTLNNLNQTIMSKLLYRALDWLTIRAIAKRMK